MPSPSTPPARSRTRTRLGFAPRALLYVVAAFALGLLLFVLIWARQRDNDDYYRPDATTRSATGREFAPLPGPDADAAGDDGRLGAAAGDESGEPTAARIEERTPAPAAPAAPTPPPAPAPPTAATAPASVPVPISQPAPRYPPAALRRGESGEALLRVHVGPDGVPYAVDLVRGSGSRLLDRAATDAVRRWRFRPAMRDGVPVDGSVQVPIAFSSGR